MPPLLLKTLIFIFSTQGLVNHYGILPRQFIWLAHIIVIAVFGFMVFRDFYRVVQHKKLFKYNIIEIILIISLSFGVYSILSKNISLLTGLIGLKNLLMFPMIYYIIRRTKNLNVNKLFKFYLYILLFQIPVIIFQGMVTHWDDEMLTGTFGWHSTGINGVIYTAVAALGIIIYLRHRSKKSLLLTLFLIIPGISGVRIAFILLAMVAVSIGLYQVLFIKNKARFLIKATILMFIAFNALDYAHLAVEKIKISNLYLSRFSSIMQLQIFGYGKNNKVTHFGRIGSLFFVWNDLNENNIILTGHGPGVARESVMGGSVSVNQGFKFVGSAGGFAPIWYEFGILGILLYILLIINCIISLVYKSLKSKYSRYNSYLLWGLSMSVLFLFGSLYTELWNTYAAFHYWLFMALIFIIVERESYVYSYSG